MKISQVTRSSSRKKNIHVLRIQRKTIKSMWHGYLKE